jgi:hypothetical protein
VTNADSSEQEDFEKPGSKQNQSLEIGHKGIGDNAFDCAKLPIPTFFTTLKHSLPSLCLIFITMLLSLFTLTLSVQLMGLLKPVMGQDAPLFIQGGLEDMTVSDAALYNSGGSIKVNGFDMAVPKNLFVQMPAAWVPWKDFVASKSDFLGFETLACEPQPTRNYSRRVY